MAAHTVVPVDAVRAALVLLRRRVRRKIRCAVQLSLAFEQTLPATADAVNIVIPAYNEESNVRTIFERIERCLPPREWLEMIFVDDGSSDGTARFVRGLRAGSPKIRTGWVWRHFCAPG